MVWKKGILQQKMAEILYFLNSSRTSILLLLSAYFPPHLVKLFPPGGARPPLPWLLTPSLTHFLHARCAHGADCHAIWKQSKERYWTPLHLLSLIPFFLTYINLQLINIIFVFVLLNILAIIHSWFKSMTCIQLTLLNITLCWDPHSVWLRGLRARLL